MCPATMGSRERQQKKWRLRQEAISTCQRVTEPGAQDGEKQGAPRALWGSPPSFLPVNLDRGVKYTLSPDKTEGKYVGVSIVLKLNCRIMRF